MSVTPDVTAVIVSWNTVDLLDSCLTSLRDHGAPGRTIEAIVVDNGSTDGSAAMVRERWPEVTLLANDDNVGFCRANNQAIALSKAPYLLLINADARLTPGCLDHLLQRMESDERAAVVAPRLEYGDGGFQRWTAGRAPSLSSVASYLFAVDRLDRRFPGLAGTYLGHDTPVAFRPDWVSSACMLVRQAAVDDIGPLDDSIFVYMDDVEFCQRARDHGWTIWYEPAATSVHLMGQSTKRRTGTASPEALRAFNRYFLGRHGRSRTTAMRALQVGGFGLRAVAYGAAGLVFHDDDRRAQARSHLSHLKLSLEIPEVAA